MYHHFHLCINLLYSSYTQTNRSIVRIVYLYRGEGFIEQVLARKYKAINLILKAISGTHSHWAPFPPSGILSSPYIFRIIL
jgi:hypothetical protein